jgi:hypothetical protein
MAEAAAQQGVHAHLRIGAQGQCLHAQKSMLMTQALIKTATQKRLSTHQGDARVLNPATHINQHNAIIILPCRLL